MRKGRDLLFEALVAYGVDWIFGNPGTTELPLIDGLVDHTRVGYILTLHEDIAVGAAAGYAQVSGRVGFVNLHVAPGLAHAAANLYNALRSEIPLVVTAGAHDTRWQIREPLLWGELVRIARPFTKWAYEVERVESLAPALARAFQIAATPPAGPVFLALPVDTLLEPTADRPLPFPRPALGPAHPDAIERAVEALRRAERPRIVAGDQVGRAGAEAELTALAERLGAPVHEEALHGYGNFPSDHPLWAGALSMEGPSLREAVGDADLLFVVGGRVPTPLLYDPQPILHPGARLLLLNEGGSEPAVAAVDLFLRGDIALTLRQITARLGEADGVARARRRARREPDRPTADEMGDGEGIAVPELMRAVRRAFPPETIFVDEAITASAALHREVPIPRAGRYLGAKGGSLGWGIPAAIGAALAAPGRPLVALIGDGSALYYPQALWTAAHHRLPFVTVICHNGAYQVLKRSLLGLGGSAAARGLLPALDLRPPTVDFTHLAAAYGLPAWRVTRKEELPGLLEAAWQTSREERLPTLIEARVAPSVRTGAPWYGTERRDRDAEVERPLPARG